MRLYPEATKKFIRESGTCRTDASVRAFNGQLRLLAQSQPDLELDQFRTEHVTAWCLSTIRMAPSPGTIRARASIAKSFFSWCVWQKLVTADPASDLKYTVKTSGQKVRHGRWLTEREVAVLLRAQPSTLRGQRDRLILMMGVMMGLRRSELSALRWDNFTSDYTRLVFSGKGQKLAQLGCPPQVAQELRSWRTKGSLGVLTVFPQMRGPYGNPQWDAEALRPDGISGVVIAAGDLAGIGAIQTHDLRRSFAGILEAKGVPITDISRLMRHANVATTMTYLESNPHRVAALAETFSLAL